MKTTRAGNGAVTEERLEKALEILSGIVAEHGEKHAPLRQMIAEQLEDLRSRGARKGRSRALARAS